MHEGVYEKQFMRVDSDFCGSSFDLNSATFRSKGSYIYKLKIKNALK